MGHKDKERLARDAAGIGPHVPLGVRLFRIHELKDWKVAEGEPDVRGWSVMTISGRPIGKIVDLLVDPSRGEVVMLEIRLEENGEHTLAPIRAAQFDRANKIVNLDSGDVQSTSAPSLVSTETHTSLGDTLPRPRKLVIPETPEQPRP